MKSCHFEIESYVPLKTTKYLIEFCAFYQNFDLIHINSSTITTSEVIKEFEKVIKALLEH